MQDVYFVIEQRTLAVLWEFFPWRKQISPVTNLTVIEKRKVVETTLAHILSISLYEVKLR
jgi:hypothetical protein